MNTAIEINDLYVEYKTNKGISGKTEIIKAVNGVDLDIRKGEIFAIAGESGCGKSTLARTILNLEKIKSGNIKVFENNLSNMLKNEIKDYRKKIQMVFQNPFSSLNPKMTIFETLAEPLVINTNYNKEEIRQIVLEKIGQVGLNEDCLKLYPHEFSGGQRQRIAIARALVLNPEIIVADEPVSALDVSIQAQIINLLKELKEKFNLTIILITHDMRVIEYLADRCAVMYLGEIIELGNTSEIFNNPKHPYTKALLTAVPQVGKTKKNLAQIDGELPSPSNLPNGCKFHTRCSYVMDSCKLTPPNVISFNENHCAKCFLYE